VGGRWCRGAGAEAAIAGSTTPPTAALDGEGQLVSGQRTFNQCFSFQIGAQGMPEDSSICMEAQP